MLQNYATVSSTGANIASPWKIVDWWRNPFGLSIAVYSSGGNYWVEATLEDPTSITARPSSASTSSNVTFVSSAVSVGSSALVPGVFLASALSGGGIAAGAVNAVGYISQPIAAWRIVTSSSTAGGTIAAVSLQSGPR